MHQKSLKAVFHTPLQLIYSVSLKSFIYQLSVEVLLVKMSPKRNIESLYGLIKAKLSQHLKNETSVDEGEGGGANENECPILCSAPTLFRSTATVNSTR